MTAWFRVWFFSIRNCIDFYFWGYSRGFIYSHGVIAALTALTSKYQPPFPSWSFTPYLDNIYYLKYSLFSLLVRAHWISMNACIATVWAKKSTVSWLHWLPNTNPLLYPAPSHLFYMSYPMPPKKNQGWNPSLSLTSKWLWYLASNYHPQVTSACCTKFFFHCNAAILEAQAFLLHLNINCDNWDKITRPMNMPLSWNQLPCLLLSVTSTMPPKFRRHITCIMLPNRVFYLKRIWCGDTFGGMMRMRLGIILNKNLKTPSPRIRVMKIGRRESLTQIGIRDLNFRTRISSYMQEMQWCRHWICGWVHPLRGHWKYWGKLFINQEIYVISFISTKKEEQLVVLDAMIKIAHTGISGMKRKISKEKLQIFTGVVVLFVLQKDDSGSYAPSWTLLGVNRQGNYTARGLENRAAYDKHVQLTGDIVPGEMVPCRYGFG